jgi:hypothetical protein
MLIKHENKKNKCNQATEFKCNNCKKCFKQKNNLIEHQRKDVCSEKVISEIHQEKNKMIDDKTIKEIITSTTNNKILLLKAIGVQLPDNDIMDIINSEISIQSKIIVIKSCINKVKSVSTNSNNTNSNNNNSNNTTNNIQINSFGSENIDYLTDEYFVKLLKNNYGKDSFLKLSNEIYLNKEKPENNTIKIDNLNNKWCKVIENNKWITTTKDSAKEKIFSKVSDIILLILDDIKDKVPAEKREIIAEFLEKDVDDDYIKEILAEMVLKIYNFTINDLKN